MRIKDYYFGAKVLFKFNGSLKASHPPQVEINQSKIAVMGATSIEVFDYPNFLVKRYS